MMETKHIETAARILFNDINSFIHYLRAEGFTITTEETIAAFRALEKLHIADETEVFLGLRTVLCSTRMERDRFEHLFTAFFHGTQNENDLKERTNGSHANGDDKKEQKPTETEDEVIETNIASEEENTTERIGQKNSSDAMTEKKETSFLQAVLQSQTASKQIRTVSIPSDHYADLLKAARLFIHSVRLKPNRRWQAQPNGRRIDLRRTFRKSISTGGYAINPAKSERRKNKARFVLLCDGSRSMAPYTKLFLQFAAAILRETAQTELFLFSTEVRRVTHLLKKAYPPHNLSLRNLGSEWGGGTCIGEALTNVIQEKRPQLLSKQTIFIIFSDGLESGELFTLENGMRTLKQRVNCIIWLNPLKGKSGYEPLARGMHIALKYIDIFAEAHDVTAFYKLAQCMRQRRE